jgi:mRNA interferase HigB
VNSADAQNALESWYEEASASVVAGNRVVFNTCGNKYRLVVEMQYRAGIAWIKFIGAHKQYDVINVTEAQP